MTDHDRRLTDITVDSLDSTGIDEIAELTGKDGATARAIAVDAANSIVVALGAHAAQPGGTAKIDAVIQHAGTIAPSLTTSLAADGAGAPVDPDPIGEATGAAETIAARYGIPRSQAARLTSAIEPYVLSELARERAAGTLPSVLGARLIAERDRLAIDDPPLVTATQAETTRVLGPREPLGPDDSEVAEDLRRKQGAARWRRRIVWPLAAAFAVLGVVLALLLSQLTQDDGSQSAPELPPAPAEVAPPPAPPPRDPVQPPPDEPTLRTIIDVAAEDGSLSAFLAALDAAGLTEQLRGTSTFTLLAPTDQAVAAAQAASEDNVLTTNLELHLVEGALFASDLRALPEVTTLAGTTLALSSAGSSIVVANATINRPDLIGDNGVIHIVDEVITADTEPEPSPPPKELSFVGAIGTLPDLTVLATALDGTVLAEELAMGEFTLLAPNDLAFADVETGQLDELLADDDLRDALLRGHLIDGSLDATTLEARDQVRTTYGTSLAITKDGGDLLIGGARILEADIQTRNGLVHVVDHVIVPTSSDPDATDARSLAELVADEESLTVLASGIESSGLDAELASTRPFTLLAPTDAAWELLPDETLQRLLTDPDTLRTVLNAHLIEGTLDTTEISARDKVASVDGDRLAVVTRGGRSWIAGAAFSGQNSPAANGVMYTIDRVLIPASVTDVDTTVNEILSLGGITFELGSAQITPAGRLVLNRAASYLVTTGLKVEIGGHTDNEGTEADNQELSEARADAVRAFLITRGVRGGTLSAAGFGEAQPIAPNDTDEGRAANRRIDFTIVS